MINAYWNRNFGSAVSSGLQIFSALAREWLCDFAEQGELFSPRKTCLSKAPDNLGNGDYFNFQDSSELIRTGGWLQWFITNWMVWMGWIVEATESIFKAKSTSLRHPQRPKVPFPSSDSFKSLPVREDRLGLSGWWTFWCFFGAFGGCQGFWPGHKIGNNYL